MTTRQASARLAEIRMLVALGQPNVLDKEREFWRDALETVRDAINADDPATALAQCAEVTMLALGTRDAGTDSLLALIETTHYEAGYEEGREDARRAPSQEIE